MENSYQDMYLDKYLFDFLGYQCGHSYFNAENEKVIGKMKDEMDGDLIKEFVGLKIKRHLILTTKVMKARKTNEIKKAKVFKKNVA